VHKIEGIGDGFIPEVLQVEYLDGIVNIASDEAIEMARRLAREEGIFCGISSGCNVAAALKVAQRYPDIGMIVTLINDNGLRYFSTELCGESAKDFHSPDRDHSLSADEQALLARLSVFAGRFALPDVEAVCSTGDLPAAAVLDVLSSLLDKSLVVKDDVDGDSWYRLHETMRDFASLKLRAAGEEGDVRRRCAAHYLSRCGLFAAEGRYRLLDWLPWIELEIDNVRSVLRRALDEPDYALGLGLVTSLIWYWITRATSEGVAWADELLGQVPAHVVPPWTYFLRGFLGVLQNDPAAAAPALGRGVAAARAAGQPPVLVQSLAMASIAAALAGSG
jgi:hypothetical protein